MWLGESMKHHKQAAGYTYTYTVQYEYIMKKKGLKVCGWEKV